MKTIKELKEKMSVGSVWHGQHLVNGIDYGNRTIVKAKSTSVVFEYPDGRKSRLTIPKKTEVNFIDDKTFEVFENGKPILRYKLIHSPK